MNEGRRIFKPFEVRIMQSFAERTMKSDGHTQEEIDAVIADRDWIHEFCTRRLHEITDPDAREEMSAIVNKPLSPEYKILSREEIDSLLAELESEEKAPKDI